MRPILGDNGAIGRWRAAAAWFFADRRVLVAVVVLASSVVASAALADIGDVVVSIIGGALGIIISFVGKVLLMLIGVLLSIAEYNNFVSAPAVAVGWVIVRDITNMFFILILLVIAFGTMLGVQGYSYQQTLPRLLIMAIVINFSRTICGLFIDLGQVFMLTFVSGFSNAAAGNFVSMFKVSEAIESAPQGEGAITGTNIIVSLILGVVMLVIACGVVIIMITTLLMRIIYLWLLVVLSPLTFFLKAVPGGKASGYYAEWWSMFTSNIITGPVLAFFLWLALVSVQTPAYNTQFASPDGTVEGTSSKAFSQAQVQQFMIGIGMLLGGVMMAQKAGGAGVGVGQKLAKGAGKLVGKQLYRRLGGERVTEGVKGYFAQKEGERKERLGARVAGDIALARGFEGKLKTGAARVAGATGGAVVGVSGLVLSQSQRDARRYARGAKKARAEGDVGTAEQMEMMSREAQSKGLFGRLRRAVRPDSLTREADFAKRAAKEGMVDSLKKEGGRFRGMAPKELVATALDKNAPIDDRERRAAIMQAVERGGRATDGRVGDLREALGPNPDPNVKAEFERMVAEKFPAEAENVTPQRLQQLAGKYSPSNQEMSPEGRTAFTASVDRAMATVTDSIASAIKSGSQVSKADRDALAQLVEARSRVAPAEAGKAMGLNNDGSMRPVAEGLDEQQGQQMIAMQLGALTDALKGRSGGEVLANLPAAGMKNREVSDAIMSGLKQNPTALNGAAREASTAPQVAMMDSVIDALRGGAGGEKLKKVADQPALQQFGSERGAPAPAPAGAAPAAPPPKETTVNVEATIAAENTALQQAVADMKQEISKMDASQRQGRQAEASMLEDIQSRIAKGTSTIKDEMDKLQGSMGSMSELDRQRAQAVSDRLSEVQRNTKKPPPPTG